MLLLIYESGSGKHVELSATPGQSYAQAIWLSHAVKPVPLCAGIGLCGLCKLRFASNAPEAVREELEFFSREEINAGWRLGCRHKIPYDAKSVILYLPDGSLAPSILHNLPTGKVKTACLAIDLGTTSIQWASLTPEGNMICQDSLPNSQAASGPDVISRLKYALEPAQRDQLADLVILTIESIIQRLRQKGQEPDRLCIAANSVMTHILLKHDVSSLAAAPYCLSYKGGEIIDLKLSTGKLPCVIPPLPAPYVGGDISAGLLFCVRERYEKPFLLADLGTNAELALLTPDNKLYMASIPLGPAMEGIGPCCGRPAGPGVAVSFKLGSSGIVPHFYDGLQGQYISATGYLSLFAQLLNLGLMNRDGFFISPSNPSPLSKRILADHAHGDRLQKLTVSPGMFVTASDVEMLLKIKATFRIALSRILKIAHISADEIKTFILAGAIGENVNIADLKNLGFIPYAIAEKLFLGGNSSLKGAALLAVQPSLLADLSTLCADSVTVDMANDPDFFDDFLKELAWQ